MMATALLIAACAETDELQQTVQQENANTADNVVNFSTYMGRTSTTRGGAYGSINTAKLAEADYGFGVFAYQTGTRDYDAYRTQNGTKERYPNFMYN